MSKILTGKIISVKMNKTAVFEVTWKTPHPLYKKLILKSSKFKIDTGEKTVSVGDTVTVEETRHLSKGKYFELMQKDTSPKADTK